jgi:hypothetical protein
MIYKAFFKMATFDSTLCAVIYNNNIGPSSPSLFTLWNNNLTDSIIGERGENRMMFNATYIFENLR